MAHADSIITAPVRHRRSIGDIQQILGVASQHLYELCSHQNINKWAKYKPVSSPVKDTVTGQWNKAQNRWNLPGDPGVEAATWWQNTGTRGSAGALATLQGSCGLQYEVFNDIGSTGNPNTFLSRLIKGDLPWEYLRPYGGNQSIYRQTDFEEYYHEATPPLGELGKDAHGHIPAETTPQGYRKFTLSFDTAGDDNRSLMLKYFKAGGELLSGFYLGVVLYRTNNNYRIVTGANPIGVDGDGASIECQVGYSDTGKWKMFPFLSKYQIVIDGGLPTGPYLSAGWDGTPSLPGGEEINIVPIGSDKEIILSGVFTSSAKNVIALGEVQIVNESSSQITLTGGIYVSLRIKQIGSDEPDEEILNWTYNTTIVVQREDYFILPTTTKTYTQDGDTAEIEVTHEFTGIRYDSTKEYFLVAESVDKTIVGQRGEIYDLFS